MTETILPMKRLTPLFIADPYPEKLLPAPIDTLYSTQETRNAHEKVTPIYSTSGSEDSSDAYLASLDIHPGASDADIIAVLQSCGIPIHGISQVILTKNADLPTRFNVSFNEIPGLLNLNETYQLSSKY